jgi:hypothetical protein
MADAPKTESSSSWGALEIGIVVLIIVAILSRDNVQNSSGNTNEELPAGSISEQVDYSCGLQVTSPARNSSVNASFTLRGITEGCYWVPKNGVVLSYQVIDGQGAPVSDFKTIMQNPSAPVIPFVFEESVVLTNTPKTKEGTIIFTAPALSTENQSVTVRIPIRFEK